MNDRPKRSTRPALPAPPPPSSNPRAQRRDLIQTAPELPSPRSRPSPAPVGQPVAEAEAGLSRREIKTVPGGGLNRISDGRAAAAAYVGVKPLGDSVRPPPVTFSAVKLARELLVENKEFRTEPALRGVSVPPPVVPARVTPVSSRRTLIQGCGSPQAVVAVVGLLAVTVGVLVVVATGGGRWMLPRAAVGSPAAAAEVQWEHGIDGQPGVLAPPLGPTPAQADEAAGQSAGARAPAQSADTQKSTSASASARSATSRNDTSQRSKVDSEQETAVTSASPAPSAPQKPRRSTRSPPEPPPPARPASSQPERAPPQPWLE